MEDFSEFIHEKIVSAGRKRWFYHIDLSNSNFTIEYARFNEVILTGHPCTKAEDCMIDINFHFFIGNSCKIQCAKCRVRGYKEAAHVLFNFPKKKICRECGLLCVEPDKPCMHCLFFRLYAVENKQEEICTICQESVYRTMLPCGHMFHMTCLLQMDPHVDTPACPNCRMKIPCRILNDLFGCHSDGSDDDDDFIEDDTTIGEE